MSNLVGVAQRLEEPPIDREAVGSRQKRSRVVIVQAPMKTILRVNARNEGVNVISDSNLGHCKISPKSNNNNRTERYMRSLETFNSMIEE